MERKVSFLCITGFARRYVVRYFIRAVHCQRDKVINGQSIGWKGLTAVFTLVPVTGGYPLPDRTRDFAAPTRLSVKRL